jgi:hypothetical protein
VRRRFLLAGAGLLSLTALGFRGPTVQMEAGADEGASQGGFGCGCGPLYRARYAGGGVGVKVSERPPTAPEGEGLYLHARGAFEREAVVLGNPSCTPAPPGFDKQSDVERKYCDPIDRELPPARTMYAVDARLGLGTQHLRVGIGALLFQAWRANTDRDPATQIWPSGELEYRDSGWLALAGLGAPFLHALRHPALTYYGWGYRSDEGWGLKVVVGLFRSGPALSPLHGNPTLQFQGSIPIGKRLTLQPGGNVGCYSCVLVGYLPDFMASLALRAEI